MNTFTAITSITAIIEASTLASESKTELIGLARQFLEAQEKEKIALQYHDLNRYCDFERRHSKRMSEVMSNAERTSLLNSHFAYRNRLANSVLQTNELRHRLKALARKIENEVAALHRQGNHAVLTAMLRIVRANDYSDPDTILAELDRVDGLTGNRIRETVWLIFASKKAGTAVFSQARLPCRPLDLFEPTPVQIELNAAVQAVISTRASYDKLSCEFRHAQSDYTQGQFTKYMEHAYVAGDFDRITTIAKEKSSSEARLFSAASLFEAEHAELLRVEGALEKAIEAAAAIPDYSYQTLKYLKAMSNCLGAWNLLEERSGRREGKYNTWEEERNARRESDYNACNPSKVLAELNFDSAAYFRGFK